MFVRQFQILKVNESQTVICLWWTYHVTTSCCYRNCHKIGLTLVRSWWQTSAMANEGAVAISLVTELYSSGINSSITLVGHGLNSDQRPIASKYPLLSLDIARSVSYFPTHMPFVDRWLESPWDHWTWTGLCIGSLDTVLVPQSYCFLAAWLFPYSGIYL